MHKAFCKALNYDEHKVKGKNVISDILDENMEPEADPDKVPNGKTGVMNKTKYSQKDVAKKVTETVMKKYKEHKNSNL